MFWLNLVILIDPVNGDYLNELVEKYVDRLYAIAYTKLKNNNMENAHDAEDLIQDTFIKVYLQIARFHGLTEEETIKLLTTYTLNVVRDFIKKAEHKYKKVPLVYEEDKDEYIATKDLSPEDIIIINENIDRLTNHIEQLTDEQRHTFMLKYEFGYSNKEIAATLNITETNVSTRLNRARKELVKMMKEDNHGQDNK